MQYTSDPSAVTILNDAIEQFLRQQRTINEQGDSGQATDAKPTKVVSPRKQLKLDDMVMPHDDICYTKPSRQTVYARTPLPETPYTAISTIGEANSSPFENRWPARTMRIDRPTDSVAPLRVKKRVSADVRIAASGTQPLQLIADQVPNRAQDTLKNPGAVRRSSLATRLARDREVQSPLSMLSALAMKPLLDSDYGLALNIDSMADGEDDIASPNFLDWPNEDTKSGRQRGALGTDQSRRQHMYKRLLPKESPGLVLNNNPFQDVSAWQYPIGSPGYDLHRHGRNAKVTFGGILKEKGRVLEIAKTILCFRSGIVP